jgi:hypothetical protein
MTALAEALAARDEARAKLDAATAALTRGREAAAAAQATLAQLETEERDWIARDARRRVERAVADEGPAPSLVPTEKAVIRKRQAEVTVAAEEQAVATLETAEREAREAVAAAEGAVAAATEDQLAAEAEEIAEQIETHLAEAARLGVELRRYQGDDLNTPIGQLSVRAQRTQSVRVRRVLDRLALMEADGGQLALNTPINRLPWSGTGAPAPASDFLAQRRAALINGSHVA